MIELMVVVTTIGILALMGLPSVRFARESTEAVATANDLKVFIEAIELYTTAEGAPPPEMTTSNIPDVIADYLPSKWKNTDYSWLYRKSKHNTYVYLYDLNFTAEQAIRLDSILDDGNIARGRLRIGFNGSGLIYWFNSELSSSV